MDHVYENINDYSPNRKRKILIVFDDMVVDITTNNKFKAILKELFIRCRKLNISPVFITQSYFKVPKDVWLNWTHYLIMKVNNKRITKYCDQSFCRHWLPRFYRNLQRMQKRTF